MFQTEFQETKEGACKVELSEAGVEAFLKFIYYSGVITPLKDPEIAFELLEAGHKYDIRSMEDSMLEVFAQQPSSWFGTNVDLLIRLFLLTLKVEGDGYYDLKCAVKRAM